MIVKEFNIEDLQNIKAVDEHFELRYLDLKYYANYIDTMSVVAKTVWIDNEPAFIAAVAPDGEGKFWGIFVVGEKLQQEFSRYGRKILREVLAHINDLGLDNLHTTCYNNNMKGQRLVKLLGFKETGELYDTHGRKMKQFSRVR
tara:strand:- start:5558 stop:5989 length:432 start_codon:yes stop_codon:yes gene_type:complete